MVRRRRLPGVLGFLALAGLAACGDRTREQGASVVRFVPGPCPVELPAGQRPEDVLCGTLTVPEKRSAFDGRTLDLAVAVLRATGPDPAPDPVVALSGGPGDGALAGILRNWTAEFAAPLQARHDLVFFDQRGTGFSRPFLECPEFVVAMRASFAENLSVREDGGRLVEALRSCHDRLLASGVDLASYTSAASAADIRDLMRALGYESWNLRGVSYGARLALTALRDVPDGIRSVILDSPVPLQADSDVDFGAGFERALHTLFAGCARDAACNAAYPDLEATLGALVERLNATPITLEPLDPETGERLPLVVTGDRLLLGLQQALYSSDLIPLLPLVISSVAAGNTVLLELLGASVTTGLEFISWGVRYSVGCAEETPFVTPALIAAASRGVDPELFDLGLASLTELNLATCGFWRSRVLGPIENEPVRSAVPALVLSGEYDPVTPPSYGRLAASTLTTAHVLEFPGFGHGLLPPRGPEGDRPDCALGIIARFLDDPTATPDASCIARLPRIEFVGT